MISITAPTRGANFNMAINPIILITIGVHWRPLGRKEWIGGASHGILALVVVRAWILQREKATARACLMARVLP